MAKRTGVSRSHLAGIEAKDDKMSFRVLVLAAAAFKVSVDELVGLGSDLAPGVWASSTTNGGSVDLKGFEGRGTVRVAADLPQIGLAKGEYLVIEAEAELREGRFIVVDDQAEGSRLYIVREMSPRVVIERDGAPPALLTPGFHKVRAVAVRRFREL